MPPDMQSPVEAPQVVVNPIYADIISLYKWMYTTWIPNVIYVTIDKVSFYIDENTWVIIDAPSWPTKTRKIVGGSVKEKNILDKFLSHERNRANFIPVQAPKEEKEVERIQLDEVNWINFVYNAKDNKLIIIDKEKNEYPTDEDGIALFKQKVNEAKKISVELKSTLTSSPFNFGDRILLQWPTWSGKTYQFHDVANFLLEKGEVDFAHKLTVTEWFEDLDFLCYIVMRDWAVQYIERELITQLRECANGKKMVLCLDEVNRWSRSFMNFILTLLDWVDWRHYVLNNFVKDEKIFIPTKNLLIFATMNKGSKYTWTSSMDEALNDRFSHVKFVTYNQEVEGELISQWFWDKATKVREIIDAIRKLHKDGEIASSISTRGIKMWGNAFINSIGSSEDLVSTFTDTLLYRIVNMDEFGIPNPDDIKLVLKEFHSRGFIKD